MMQRLILVLLVLIAAPVSAQSARVVSGDHEGFARLVVELPGPSDWQLGRTADGYALAVSNAPAGYDLAGVFDLIQRNRLATISVNADSGNLQFGLACACHAIPFEFRPGVIVIDIRDGPPPEGSSFEQPLGKSATIANPSGPEPVASAAASEAAPVAATGPGGPSIARVAAPPRPPRWVFSAPPAAELIVDLTPDAAARARQWPSLDVAVQPAPATDLATAVRDLSAAPAPMTALRDDLLMQISRGAARGVVDVAVAVPRPTDAGDDAVPSAAFAQVAINPVPGVVAAPFDDARDGLTADGTSCIADIRLDIAGWGRDGPVAIQISALTSGIVGEFDAVNADALRGAVTLALHLGFGVEAGRLVEVFPAPELAAEAATWISMGRIIDGHADPAGAFARMQNCDSAAALWAVLAVEHLQDDDQVNTPAVLRSFSALPLHLRLALGPTLATRFLEIGRSDVVHAIRDAIERAPAGAGHQADLIGARLGLASGENQAAAALAKGVIAQAGPAVAEAMLALVEAALAQGRSVDVDTTDALAALLREHQGAALEAELTAALILALASGGNAAAAFARLPDHPQSEAELWAVLARSGSDSDMLAHAIVPVDGVPKEVGPETRMQIAGRLLGLGFAREAALWLGPPDVGDDDAQALLVARSRLQMHEPATALELLATLSGDEAGALAAEAEMRLGNPGAAAERYRDLQEADAWQQARIQARDWRGLAESGSPPWQGAARHVAAEASAPVTLPPLAEATALLVDAAETRADISALLAGVPSPKDLDPAQSP